MKDSCSARKLDPGIAARYSMPTDFQESTMKSEPLVGDTSAAAPGGRLAVDDAVGASVSAAFWIAETPCGAFTRFGGSGSAFAVSGIAIVVAAPARAAPLRKPRRPTSVASLRFVIAPSLEE